MRFKDLKIGNRIWSITIIGISILSIIAFIGYYRIIHLQEAFQSLREESLEMRLVMELELILGRVVMPANDYLIVGGDLNEKANFETITKELKEKFDELEPHALNRPDEKEIFLNAKKYYLDSEQKARQIFTIPQEQAYGSAQAGILMEEMDSLSDKAILEIKKWDRIVDEEVSEAEEKFVRAKQEIILFNLFLILFLISSGFVVGYILTRSITKPIRSLLEAIQKVTQGDLNAQAQETSKDEIGNLSVSFNKMTKDLRRSQDELFLARDYADNIIKSLIDTLIVVTPQAKIKTVNKATSELLGYKEEELVGNDVSFLFSEQESLFEGKRFEKLLEEGWVKDYEINYKTKTGQTIPVSFSGSVMRGKDGTIVGLVGIARDMRQIKSLISGLEKARAQLEEWGKTLEKKVYDRTKDLEQSQDASLNMMEDLKEAYEKLQVMQDTLIQAEKFNAIGRLASGVAHEVKNPLGVIKQSAEYLKDKLLPSEKNASEALRMIQDNIGRADSIIRELLDFSRATKLDKKPEDINSILESSLVLIQHSPMLENVKIKRELGKDLPRVLVDKGKMEQVFINLLLNAVQAMPKGGNLFLRTYQLRLNESKGGMDASGENNFQLGENVIVIEIEDAGTGISREDLKKVFDPFFTTKDPGQGTGLGLSISKNILAMHEGLMEMNSEEGKGTKVIITLKITEGGSNEQG